MKEKEERKQEVTRKKKKKSLRKTMWDMASALCTFSYPPFLSLSVINPSPPASIPATMSF